jgi:dsRNA-specific ribonuclease
VAEGRAFNKKDASQIAAQLAVEKLSIGKEAEETE